ncbi:MAG: DUF456 family protein [Candidatus Moranbacteria bacterium]|nr:DUF456 family protein [Candidatus Moranbacteria bacterium]
MEITLQILVIIILSISVILSLIPIIPGTVIAFAIILLYAFYDKFEKIPIWLIITLFIITVLSTLIDNIAGALGVNKVKGSKYAMFGSIIGAIIGAIIFQIIGLILGTFFGVFLG